MTAQGTSYRYVECGLDNVLLQGLPVVIDDFGEEVITIPNVNILHRLLVVEVATKDGRLNGKEIRFLRTEMGMSQAELAALVGRDPQSIGRWERSEKSPEQAIEMIIRISALEHVESEHPSIEEIASWTAERATEPPILIDAHDPNNYRPIAA